MSKLVRTSAFIEGASEARKDGLGRITTSRDIALVAITTNTDVAKLVQSPIALLSSSARNG